MSYDFGQFRGAGFTKMNSFGGRLKEERTALGLSQREFGALGGVMVDTQGKYEKGTRFPKADYLTAIANRGVDVLYLLTGQKYQPKEALPAEETRIIESYRRLNHGDQSAIVRLTASLAEVAAPSARHR